MRVGPIRKKAGVPYPQAYATPDNKSKEAYIFNCAQRAHGNFLENETSFLAAMMISGLKYPTASALLGVGWLINRVIYAVGYTRQDKEGGKGRLAGAGFWLCQFALYGMTGKVGWDVLMN
jgi:glutathione S-transferase